MTRTSLKFLVLLMPIVSQLLEVESYMDLGQELFITIVSSQPSSVFKYRNISKIDSIFRANILLPPTLPK